MDGFAKVQTVVSSVTILSKLCAGENAASCLNTNLVLDFLMFDTLVDMLRVVGD